MDVLGNGHRDQLNVDSDPPGTDLSVIIVDDDQYIVDLLRRLLDTMGIGDVRTATDGKAVLRQLDGRPADVLISDVNMPGMDGVELLRHLAAREEPPALIVISAESQRILQTAHQLAQAHHLPVLGALGKPVKRERLAELLEMTSRVSEPDHDVGHTTGEPAKAFELTPVEIARGLDAGALVPHFQPKVDACTRQLHGVEALARWQHPTRGIVPPAAFVPVAERSGLISQLTRSMVESSLAQAGAWHRAGRRFAVAINVSVLDVEDLEFVTFVSDAARDRGVPPEYVTLEVTETRIVDRLTSALETLTRLRLRGFRLSLDDYGTGASTLDHIRRLPIDQVKIDRAFVDGAAGDSSLRAMLESTVSLARQLDLQTVAEGIEDAGDWKLAASLGIDLVQGYAIARPMPADGFEAWMDAQEWFV